MNKIKVGSVVKLIDDTNYYIIKKGSIGIVRWASNLEISVYWVFLLKTSQIFFLREDKIYNVYLKHIQVLVSAK